MMPAKLSMTSSTSSFGVNGRPLPEIVVLDACVLLNLFASGRVEEILRSLPFRWLVASPVCKEALWYLSPSARDAHRLERQEICFDPLIAAGRLERVDLTAPEEAAFVELAKHLGDGEAASGALAIGKSASVATDDLKAIQLFARLQPPLPTIETGAILKWWEDRSGASRKEVAAALHSIRRGSRFSPRANSIDADWWQGRLRKASLP